MTKEFYRIMVDGNGRTFVVDEANNKLDPETSLHISKSLSDTANEICYLYLMYRPEKDNYKIGISIEPDRRFIELNSKEPHELLHTYSLKAHGENCASEIELKLHKIFKAVGQHVEGEYFKLDEYDQKLFTTSTENVVDWANGIYDIFGEHIPDKLSILIYQASIIKHKRVPEDYSILMDLYMIAKAIRFQYCESDDRIFEANEILKILWHWIKAVIYNVETE